jgi:8-oxo-dGTP pyrophosphatase MutT (NUDIX family)
MSRIDDLRARLAHHQGWDQEERAHLQQLRALCQGAERGGLDLFSRANFEPGHVTASAFVLSPDRSALLLILHGKLKRWLQPGGHVEPDDLDVLAAARREVREEVGLDELSLEQPSIFDLDIHTIPALKGDPPHLHLDVRFLFRAPSEAFEAGSDAKAARWVPLSELVAAHACGDELSDRSVLRAVEKLLRGRSGA